MGWSYDYDSQFEMCQTEIKEIWDTTEEKKNSSVYANLYVQQKRICEMQIYGRSFEHTFCITICETWRWCRICAMHTYALRVTHTERANAVSRIGDKEFHGWRSGVVQCDPSYGVGIGVSKNEKEGDGSMWRRTYNQLQSHWNLRVYENDDRWCVVWIFHTI